ISSSGRMLIGTILAPFGIRNSSSALLVWVITRPPHVRCLPETSPIRANLFMPPPNASATRTHKRRISHRPPLLFEAHYANNSLAHGHFQTVTELPDVRTVQDARSKPP